MTELEKLASEYHENKIMIKQLEALNDGIKKQLIKGMKKEREYIGSFLVSYSLINSSGFDSKGLKNKYPGIYSEFVIAKQYRKFEVK